MPTPEQQVCQPVQEYEATVQKQNTDYGKTYGHLMVPSSISLTSRMMGKEAQVDQGAVDKAVDGARNAHDNLSPDQKTGLRRSNNAVAEAATGQYDTPDKNQANQLSLTDLRGACKDVPPEVAPPRPGAGNQTAQPSGAGRQLQNHACEIEKAAGGDCSTLNNSSTLGKERVKI